MDISPDSAFRLAGGELAATSAYETLLGADRMSLVDIVADSTAAISPLTGKATSAANRLLLAAVNVRLGVWLPRPANIVPRHGRIASRACPSKLRRCDSQYPSVRSPHGSLRSDKG